MVQNRLSRNQVRLMHDCGQVKRRVRLYKKGKSWLTAGVTTIVLGLVTLGGETTAQANRSQTTSADSVTTQGDANSIANASQATLKTSPAAKTSSSVADQTPSSAADTSSTQSAASSASSSTSSADSSSASSSAAQTDSSQTRASGTTSTSEGSTAPVTNTAAPTSSGIAAAFRAAVSPTRLQMTTPITVTTTSAQTETKLGGDAVFTVEFNVTGIKTSAKNAVLNIKVPTGTTLEGDLSQYAISGTVPTFENGEIIYKFGNLPAGTTARMVYDFKTDKTALENGDEVLFDDNFSADGLTPIEGSASTTVTAADSTSITTLATQITDADGNVKSYASSGDNVTWTIGGQIYTSQPGVELVDPTKPIIVTEVIDSSLVYLGVTAASGSTVTVPEPTVTTDAAGNTVLTWTIQPNDEATQQQQDQIFKFNVQTKIPENTPDWTNIQSSPQINYTTTTGETINKQDTTPSPSVLVTNGHPQLYDEQGQTWVTGQISSADGDGNIDPDQNALNNLDPVVVSQDNPILTWVDLVNENTLGAGKSQGKLLQWYGDYKYFAVLQTIDPGETLQGITLEPADYAPNAAFYLQYGYLDSLYVQPKVTLAVEYAGSTQYQVLADNLATNGTTSLTRGDLVNMGLDPNKDVKYVWLYYHKDGEGELPSTNAEDMTPDTAWTDTPTGATMKLPEGSWAPLGIYEPIMFTTSVKPGFVGQISHDFMPQYILKTTDNSTLTQDYPTQYYFLQPSDRDSGDHIYHAIGSLASTVEVTSQPEGTSRIVTADVLVDGKPVGSQLIPGEHAVTVSATLSQDSLSRLVGNDPFTYYTLLDKGVTLAADNSFATVVDNDYQGTGKQLMKVYEDATSYLSPGDESSATFNVNISKDAPAQLNFTTTFMSPMPDIKVPTSQDENGETSILGDDTADLDQNGDQTQKTVTASARYELLKTDSLQVVGSISGSDNQFGTVATVQPDTDVTVHLNTTNSTDAELQELNLVDWLPTVGDTGLTTADARGSQFAATLTSPITLPAAWQGKVAVKYTTTLKTGVDPSDATWVDASSVTDW